MRQQYTCVMCGRVFESPTRNARYCSRSCIGKSHKIVQTPERFWSFVDKRGRDECWNWTLAVNHKGYGQFSYNGKGWIVSRLAWTLTNGEIPKGMLVCHSCDNPRCANPDHLFLGTARDNTRDMIAKGRQGEQVGSATFNAKLDEDKVRAIRHELSAHTGSRYGLLASMSRKYGVSTDCIRDIERGKSWQHIA